MHCVHACFVVLPSVVVVFLMFYFAQTAYVTFLIGSTLLVKVKTVFKSLFGWVSSSRITNFHPSQINV